MDTKTRTSHISWIPFSKMPEMYKDIEKTMKATNGNHFGFDGMQITELAQYTLNIHLEVFMIGIWIQMLTFAHEPPVRKISMTCLLSHESEFEGGELQLEKEKNKVKLVQGQAVFFASFLLHKVAPVTRGVRKSLVMWFGGPPLR